jgi:hypothetical protein
MTTSEMETVEQVWPTLAPLLFVPHTEHEYERLIQMLDTLFVKQYAIAAQQGFAADGAVRPQDRGVFDSWNLLDCLPDL